MQRSAVVIDEDIIIDTEKYLKRILFALMNFEHRNKK